MPVADYATCSRMLVRTRGSRFAHPVIRVASPIVAKTVIKALTASGHGEVFASGPAVKDIPLGAISSVERLQPMAEHCNVYVALHADHCQPKNPDKFLLPPLNESERRCQAGLSSLFNNPLSDGSGIRS